MTSTRRIHFISFREDVLCDNNRREIQTRRGPGPSGWTAPVGNIGVGGDCWTVATTVRSPFPPRCAPFRAWVSCPTSYKGTKPQTAGTDLRPRPPYRG